MPLYEPWRRVPGSRPSREERAEPRHEMDEVLTSRHLVPAWSYYRLLVPQRHAGWLFVYVAAALIGLALIAVTIAVIQGGLSAALMIALAVAAVGAGALILLVAIVGGFLALSAGFDAARAAPRRAMTALHRRGR